MIALGCDHGGYELKQEIKKYLDENGILFVCFPVTAIAAVLSRSPICISIPNLKN